MAVITYTAKRRLIDGHEEGEVYSFDLCLNDWQPSVRNQTESATSLSGRRFTTYHRSDEVWRVGTPATRDKALLAQLEEFLWSVAAGEQFTISDPLRGGELDVALEGDPSQTMANLRMFYSSSFQVRRFI